MYGQRGESGAGGTDCLMRFILLFDTGVIVLRFGGWVVAQTFFSTGTINLESDGPKRTQVTPATTSGHNCVQALPLPGVVSTDDLGEVVRSSSLDPTIPSKEFLGRKKR
eukprot:1272471-Rhodomonas_salina.2